MRETAAGQRGVEASRALDVVLEQLLALSGIAGTLVLSFALPHVVDMVGRGGRRGAAAARLDLEVAVLGCVWKKAGLVADSAKVASCRCLPK